MSTLLVTSSLWLLCGLVTYIWGSFFAARDSQRDPWRGIRIEATYFTIVLLLGPILPIGLAYETYVLNRDI